MHHPSSKTQVHKAVRHTYNAHFPLLNYICTSAHTCKHTSDSCLLSRMLNCSLVKSAGSQVLKQTVPCVKEIQTHIQVRSGDRPESLTRPHHSHFFLDRFKPPLVQELQKSICVLCDVKKGTGLLKSLMKFSGFIFLQESNKHLMWQETPLLICFPNTKIQCINAVSWLESVTMLGCLQHLWKHMIDELGLSRKSRFFFFLCR